ncbi:MAG: aminoacyl-tRNA hydrolase [Acidobacteriota bacterium]
MLLIVGLGNPGPEHAETRHNVGFMVLDRMASESGQSFKPTLKRSLICRLDKPNPSVVLAKPQTYVNRSGLAVHEFLQSFPDLTSLLIVYDDFALPLGTIRIRRSGSAGGQKGMKSIIEALGSQDVPRLRVGVLGDRPVQDYSEYVLSPFRRAERETLDEVLDRSVRAIDTIIQDGLERAMHVFN